MILFHKEKDFDLPVNERIHLIHDRDEIMELARDLFSDDPSLREEAIPVLESPGGDTAYYLTWSSNMHKKPESGFFSYFHLYTSEQWDYSYTDDRMDFELLDRGDVWIFEQFEEYTYAIAKIIRKYFPDKYILFKDRIALDFFDESDHLRCVDDEADLYNRFRFLLPKSIYAVRTERLGIAPHTRKSYFEKTYTSIEVMTSLYWMTDEVSYGEMHPDKTFFLINSPLGMMGLSDLIRFRLFNAEVVRSRKKGHIIPVIDLSVKGDGNQFSGGDGRNVWTMFFEQLTDIPLEEVYQSKHVIRGGDQLFYSNPYLKEQSYFGDLSYLFRKYLRFNSAVQEYVDNMYKKVIPADAGRILGVIGRGTDYNQSIVKSILHKPAGPEELVEKVSALVKEQNYDHVFLATEDAVIFRTFSESALAPVLLSVDQERVEYNEKEDKLLIELYEDRKEKGYRDTVRYISIIYILSRCTSLVASTDCGAYLLAMGFNDHRYEYVKVFTDAEVVRQ